MKKYYCILLFFFTCNLLFAQDVIIGGVNKNRPLTWADFKGVPDKNSWHDAATFWTIDYSIKGISFKGDTAKVVGFSITLTLDDNVCWSKPEKQTDALLKHEQGHFDIGLICQREVLKQLNSTVFFRSDFRDKIPSIVNSLLEKYHAMGFKYDEETNHSKNQAAQDKWNNYFATALK